MDIAEVSKQAYDYSVRIVELVRFLKADDKNFPLSEELLSCGVTVGMTLRSKKRKSIKKASAALQKAEYLITMAVGSGYLTPTQSRCLLEQTELLLQRLRPLSSERATLSCPSKRQR